MEIAVLAPAERQEAFSSLERALVGAASGFGMGGSAIAEFIAFQMKTVRTMVLEIDASGAPQGGHA